MFDPTESRLADEAWDERLDQLVEEMAGRRVEDARDPGASWDAASEA